MSSRAVTIAKIKAWPWVKILQIAGFLLALLLVLWVFYRIFILPGELRREAFQEKQNSVAAQGEANVIRGTLDVMENRVEYHNTVREITRENTREIRSAEGASDRIPPAVHDAGINAIGRLREAAGEHHNQVD